MIVLLHPKIDFPNPTLEAIQRYKTIVHLLFKVNILVTIPFKMPRKSQNSTPWREKRRGQAEGITNARRLSKTNRERFRRQKKAAFRGANRLFVDGLDTGRDRRIYVLIMEKMKSGPRYTTYDSHPKGEWIPAAEEVVSRVNMKWKRRRSQSLISIQAKNWPRTDTWDPSDFGDSPKANDHGTKAKTPQMICGQKTFRRTLIIPRPPFLHL